MYLVPPGISYKNGQLPEVFFRKKKPFTIELTDCVTLLYLAVPELAEVLWSGVLLRCWKTLRSVFLGFSSETECLPLDPVFSLSLPLRRTVPFEQDYTTCLLPCFTTQRCMSIH